METKEYKLTDVCDFQGGTQPPKEEWITEPRDGYVRMLQIRDFTQDKAEHVGYVKDTKKLNKCEEDDILIGRYGASVGKILTGLAGAYNVAIIKTIPNVELLSKRYLYYVLTGTNFQNFILNIGARAAQAGFNKTDLSLFKLHIPTSLDDQERIADVLSKAKNILDLRQNSIKLQEKYLEDLFHKSFGQSLFLSSEKSLGDYLKLKGGAAFKSSDFTDNGVPVIKIGTVNKGYFDLSASSFLPDSFKEEYKKYLIYADNLLISLTGTVGKDDYANTCFASDEYPFYFLNQRVAQIVPIAGKLNLHFASYLFSYPQVKKMLISANRGVRQANLSNNDIYSLRLNLPSIEVQNDFGEKVIRFKSLGKYLSKSEQKITELYNSLCNKALKGELEIVKKTFLEGTIKVQPKITGEVIEIDKINKELEEFHKSQPLTGAPDQIDNTIRQLEAELKIKGEIPFWDEYVKYRIVKGKFKEPFTFNQLWEEITKLPFETVPEYDDVATLLFKWLAEENAFIRQQFNESTKQIELIVNETAKA
jgi:type I restriction enzyme S subunit